MNQSENQLLTRVGPGTPMGNFLRQYWIPVLQSTDLPENDGAPLRVRLLCENLVASCNTDDQVGLIDHVCPHPSLRAIVGRHVCDKARNVERPGAARWFFAGALRR